MNNQRNRQGMYYILLLAGWFAACNPASKDPGREEQSSERNHTPTTILAVESSVYEELQLHGNVVSDAQRMSKVFIPCSGKIQQIYVEKGDYVKAGQRLATLLAVSAADYDKQWADLTAEMKLAQREWEMKRDLYQSGMASDLELHEAESRLSRAQAEMERLQSTAQVNGYASQAQVHITAPISGYIFAQNIHTGSFIDETSSDTSAFEITDLSQVWVVADVYESDIPLITLGAKAGITLPTYPGKTLEGKIDKIYRKLDEESKTLKIGIRLHNPEEKLLPGMFADVHLQLTDTQRLLWQLPASCIVFDDGIHYVVVVEDESGQRRKQPVKIVRQNEQTAYLEQGVGEGDRVVSQNALLEFNKLK